MEESAILVVNWRESTAASSVAVDLQSMGIIQKIEKGHSILSAVRSFKPNWICFEFDKPNRQGLEALTHTKEQFPALPVVMITQVHSEALTLWALRNRVWNYFVNPIKTEDLVECVAQLKLITQCINRQLPRNYISLNSELPWEISRYQPSPQGDLTRAAVNYVQMRSSETIRQQHVAKLCHMSVSRFSRTFHLEHGITFREFLLQHRIGKSVKMLRDPCVSVTSVALAVGFQDLSNFCRTFQRYIGMSPTAWCSFSNNKIRNVHPM